MFRVYSWALLYYRNTHSMSHVTQIEAVRHTLAHLLAACVRELYPGAKNAIGPAIENGFYQDFELPSPISDADLKAIEKLMKKRLHTWKEFERKEVTPEEAKKEFAWNEYKCELIDEFAKDAKTLTFYTSGGFVDLCKGGHTEHPAKDIDVDAFTLVRVAGAYWRGDEKNKMLTRIYGLAFATKEELDAYIAQQEEAKKRDHKKIGKELRLFTFSELVGPGLPLWTPRGTIVREELNDFVWELRKAHGYKKVTIPHITKHSLYETSGHWAKYADDLFKINTRDGHTFAMKPMNCPHHTQIFDAEPRSYRAMPQRYCESTMVYRDEQTGELSGITRVLAITQDDAHVFCRVNQIEHEVASVWDIVQTFYSKFGFALRPRLSRRDPATPEKYLGDVANWDIAENKLREVIEKNFGADYIDGPGEAAFYGPKIDFMAHDAIGRTHQIATIQLDFVQPQRFDLTCVNEKGEKEHIAMIHCAIMGSFERFLAILIEHCAGAFPLWLSPVQVVVVPVNDVHNAYAEEVRTQLQNKNVRVEFSPADESLGKRIRTAKQEKVPYVLVIGDKEVAAAQVTIESRDTGAQTTEPRDSFMERIVREIRERTLTTA